MLGEQYCYYNTSLLSQSYLINCFYDTWRQLKLFMSFNDYVVQMAGWGPAGCKGKEDVSSAQNEFPSGI